MTSPDIDLGAGFGKGKLDLPTDHKRPYPREFFSGISPDCYPIEGGLDKSVLPETDESPHDQTLPLAADIFDHIPTHTSTSQRYYPRTKTFK